MAAPNSVTGSPVVGGKVALLLSNFPRTGIGAFGVELQRALEAAGVGVRFEAAATSWRGFVRQSLRVLRTPAPVIANIGLTSWGTSRLRNLLGLWTLGARARRGRPTTVLLHNLIESVNPANAGYRVGWLSRYFAHRGVAGLRRCLILVFSQELAEVLRSSYRIEPARVGPLPCPPPSRPVERYDRPPKIVYFGYLSPYKGLDLFLSAVGSAGSQYRSAILGDPHSLLQSDERYRRFLAEIREHAQRVGTELAGYLPDQELASQLERAFVAILPYTSTTGASASFTQLAGAGLPVVATDLPEFRALRDGGAGIVLVSPDGESIRAAVEQLLRETATWNELSRRQLEYAKRHPWTELAGWLIQSSLDAQPTLGGKH